MDLQYSKVDSGDYLCFFFGGNGCHSWGVIVLRNYDQPELL